MSDRSPALAVATAAAVATVAVAAVAGCGVSVPLSDPASPAPTPAPAPAARSAAAPAPTPAPAPERGTPDRSTAGAGDGAAVRRGPPAPPAAQPAPRLDTWQVGASPLPLRPDGYGRSLPTPRELQVRRLPTADRLPPPAGGAFSSSVDPVSERVRRRMGRTWTPGCPVAVRDLRYVRVSFWGFDRSPHTGELVVNARVARDVVGVFRRLYRTRYPIEEMRLVTTHDLNAHPTGDGNNTAAFVCRPVRGGGGWSAHAYGLAVDVNPFLNPYDDGDLVLPELAGAYLDRGWRRPGMVTAHGEVVDAFTAVGWTWGGTFESVSDPMHFSATGR